MHDPTLDRTTSGSGDVIAHTLDEIRQLDAGSWFDPEFAGMRVPAEVYTPSPRPYRGLGEIDYPLHGWATSRAQRITSVPVVA